MESAAVIALPLASRNEAPPFDKRHQGLMRRARQEGDLAPADEPLGAAQATRQVSKTG